MIRFKKCYKNFIYSAIIFQLALNLKHNIRKSTHVYCVK